MKKKFREKLEKVETIQEFMKLTGIQRQDEIVNLLVLAYLISEALGLQE